MIPISAATPIATWKRFGPGAPTPGTRGGYALPITRLPDGSELLLPVLTAAGAGDGPTLVVLAGVHGDEYEGIRAIPQVLRALDVDALRGRLITVPVCNVPAYLTATRGSPIDGLNLARVFPGDPHGSVTSRIAHVLTEQIIARASLLIDLHSAGIAYSMPTLVGYSYTDDTLGRASYAAAQAFGCDVVWGHPPDPTATGRTISAAGALGVPWIYTEAAGGGRTRAADVRCYVDGVLNVMRLLGMLPGSSAAHAPTHHLLGAGNTDAGVRAGQAGYFVSHVELLETVAAGQVIGAILDFAGETIEALAAPRDGRVVMIRGVPVIHPGEGAFLLTGDMPAS